MGTIVVDGNRGICNICENRSSKLTINFKRMGQDYSVIQKKVS